VNEIATPERAIELAAVLSPSGRVEVDADGFSIGGADDNDLILDDPRVSPYHARIAVVNGAYRIIDLDSANATLLNGERLRGHAAPGSGGAARAGAAGSRVLSSGDTISVGDTDLRFIVGVAPQPSSTAPISGTRQLRFTGKPLTIGRHPDNDVFLEDPKVSLFHAEVRAATNGIVEVRDLDTVTGTRVNGRLVGRARLQTGSEIGVGSFRLIFGDDSILARDDRNGLRLDAQNVSVRAGRKTILEPTTLSIEAGEFVAIIGESGAGKSTLLKALAGVIQPQAGSVLVSGDPISSRQSEIGYVPQDEIVHPALTVREALHYSARLRLPDDAQATEITQAVDRVIKDLHLADHADTPIKALSGGQRKRAGVGTELLSEPGLLLLDEATTGLDPPLERHMMQLMHDLATAGRMVVTVTHATGSLDLASKLTVMGAGGELCFHGPPTRALEFFGVEGYSEIYLRLEERPAIEWRKQFEASELAPPAPSERTLPPAGGRKTGTGRSSRRQVNVLARRYARAFRRDRTNMLIMFAPVPVLAALLAAIFTRDPFFGSGRDASTFIFLLVTTAIWFGALGAAREVVKDRTVFVRERDVGVRSSAYLASKLLVLFAVVAVQVLIVVAVGLGVHRLGEPASAYGGVVVALLVSGFTGVAFGLLISSLVKREEQAVSALPYLLIPQLALSGALVPIASLGKPLALLSNVIFARWSFETTGALAKLGRLRDLSPAGVYGDFFTRSWTIGMTVLLAFLAILLALIRRSLEWRPES
jgi:ABC-type multidrug transport system ATPase subunit/ABC-type multidrug transport system permease subunit